MNLRRLALAGAGLILASVFFAPQSVSAATSVNEDFEDGVANGFTVPTGSYSIITDGSRVYRTASATARAVVGDPASSNVEVQAAVKVASWSGSTGLTAGLMARYIDANNYYLFIYEDGQLKIRKKVSGTLTTVASKAYTLNTGAWYTFKAVANGTTLTLSVNGVQQLTATTTGNTVGKVGLVSFRGDVRYDNVIAKDLGGSTYDSLVLAGSPIAYFPLGGTGSVVDFSGRGHVGSYKGSPAITPLPNGDPATRFNGSSQYVEIRDAADLSVPTTGVLTIEAWMRPDVLQFPNQQSSGYVHWMGKGVSGQHEYVSRMYSRQNQENRPNRISGYSFNLSGGLGAGSYFQDPVTVGQWIHYTLIINTKNRSSAYPTGYTKIYKNGVLRDQDSLQGYNITPGNGTAPLRIGTRDFASYFQGAVGKVAIYNYELTAATLSEHFNAM